MPYASSYISAILATESFTDSIKKRMKPFSDASFNTRPEVFVALWVYLFLDPWDVLRITVPHSLRQESFDFFLSKPRYAPRNYWMHHVIIIS